MSSKNPMRNALAGSAALCLLVLSACSSDDPDDPNPGTGGASTGGVPMGGASDGGTSTGGMPMGGASTGGVSMGGDGGTSSGGMPTGGASTGGVDGSGGAATGGDGTGGTGGDSAGGDGTGGDGGGSSGEFTLTSTELMDGGAFPEQNTCASGMGSMGFGEAISLEWSGFPEGTRSFALTMIDVTLVDGDDNYLGCHSAFWNVPVETTSMPASDWSSALSGAANIRDGYLGPCPNFNTTGNEDTYVFTLYAMGDATLSDPAINSQAFGNISDCNAFRQALDDASLESVTLTGTSDAVNGGG